MTLLLVLFSELGGDPDEPDDEAQEDDLLGGADDGLMGDDMFGDDGGGGSSDEDELNYQLDEIEKEVDSLSGRIETVRGENEQISDSIQSVERNVDKLVDLYEIVTHGINPFVGDQEIGDAFETATGQAGLIGNDPDDAIDEEIASAEAEDFLDDDMPFEDDDTDDFGTDFEDDDDDPLEGEVLDEEITDDEIADEDVLDDEDGFADGDALEAAGVDEALDGEDENEDEDDLTRFLPDEEGGEVDANDAEADDSFDDTEIDSVDDEDESFEADTDAELGGSEPVVQAGNGPGGSEIDTPPYLDTHPSGYAAEITTLEWLEFLVETAGVEGAAQTVAYYRSVGWISEAVETYLHRMLAGFGDERTVPPEDPDPQSILRTDDHKRSLQFIAQIATPERQTTLVDATGGAVVDQSTDSSEPAANLDDVETVDGDGLAADSLETESAGAVGTEVDSIEDADGVSIDDMKPDPLEDQVSGSVDGEQTLETDGTEEVGGRPDGADDPDLEEW